MKLIIIFALLLGIISCNRAEINITEKTIKQLSKGDFELPSVNGSAILFVSCETNEKALTNVNVLNEVFLKYYSKKYLNFKSFLFDALHQKINFSKEDLDKWGSVQFELNPEVHETYNQSSISNFIAEYFDVTEDKNKFVVNTKHRKDVFSILYYCFINDYRVTLDDYHGRYFITKSLD